MCALLLCAVGVPAVAGADECPSCDSPTVLSIVHEPQTLHNLTWLLQTAYHADVSLSVCLATGVVGALIGAALIATCLIMYIFDKRRGRRSAAAGAPNEPCMHVF